VEGRDRIYRPSILQGMKKSTINIRHNKSLRAETVRIPNPSCFLLPKNINNGHVVRTSVAHPVDVDRVSSSKLGRVTGYPEVRLPSFSPDECQGKHL
jgi:hypothetical protein